MKQKVEKTSIFWLHILNSLKETRLKIMNCWKQIEVMLINLIFLFEIVEKTPLKIYE